MGYTFHTQPSSPVISTPVFPASSKGDKMRPIDSWNNLWFRTLCSCLVICLRLILSTERYPMRTHACLEGLRLMLLGIFPSMRYTGYADFPPVNCVNCVLSVTMITGESVAPTGR